MRWPFSSSLVPTEVHLITTGANRVRLSLLSESPGGFHALRKDYGLPEIGFPESNIHVLIDAEGQPLDDIRTPDNRIAADLITSIQRELTADPESALHVSIAGGRKTRLRTDAVRSYAGSLVACARNGAL